MKAPEITLKGKTFKLSNGIEVFMTLGELWKLDTLEEVNEQFQMLAQLSPAMNATPLKVFKVISEVLSVMISVHEDNKETLTPVQIRGCSMEEFQHIVAELTNCINSSMPHGDQSETEEGKKTLPKSKNKNP
ncbi:hypothetical protein [uncultured Flavobacterium sp.]|uniref:hypothetical protein n=1 Tax=uncultured Flavobacterium sp. TaxID=165435 RepID=UPI0025FC85EC|nr:hypothetical protein [uncultured Flavobacterium sp.]